MKDSLLLKGCAVLTAIALAACSGNSERAARNRELQRRSTENRTKIERLEVEGEAKLNLIDLTGKHAAFRVTAEKFASEINPSGVETLEEDGPDYKYEVIAADEQRILITVTAKSNKFSSFSAIVAVVAAQDDRPESTEESTSEDDREDRPPPGRSPSLEAAPPGRTVIESLICKTDQPSKTPPKIAGVSSCPAGSSAD